MKCTKMDVLYFICMYVTDCIQVLGTDDATTCHIVILRHTGNHISLAISRMVVGRIMQEAVLVFRRLSAICKLFF